jgi:hypothetical protein
MFVSSRGKYCERSTTIRRILHTNRKEVDDEETMGCGSSKHQVLDGGDDFEGPLGTSDNFQLQELPQELPQEPPQDLPHDRPKDLLAVSGHLFLGETPTKLVRPSSRIYNDDALSPSSQLSFVLLTQKSLLPEQWLAEPSGFYDFKGSSAKSEQPEFGLFTSKFAFPETPTEPKLPKERLREVKKEHSLSPPPPQIVHDDEPDHVSVVSDDDDLIQVLKVTRGETEYLELSMDFLDFDGVDAMNASPGSFSSGDVGFQTREKRRGKRRGQNGALGGSGGVQNPEQPTAEDDKIETHRAEDSPLQGSARSLGSSFSKGKRKDRRRKHRNRLAEVANGNKVDHLNASLSLEDIGDINDDDRHRSSTNLHGSHGSSGSKRRKSNKDKKRKKRDKKTKEGSSGEFDIMGDDYGMPSPVKLEEPVLPDALMKEAESLFEDASPNVDAQLAVLDDVWMGKSEADSQFRVGLDETVVTLPAIFQDDDDDDDEEEDEGEPRNDRALNEILDVDSWWDLKKSGYSNKEAMATIERDPSACSKKYQFNSFGSEMYPLSMMCAIGASVEALKLCYESYPGAIKEKVAGFGSPLHCACAHAGTVDLIGWLIETDPTLVDIVDPLQRSAFHVACMYSPRADALAVLIEKAPEGLGKQDYDGNTALHLACENDVSLDVVELLAQKYPDSVRTRRKDGSTPLHLALSTDYDETKIKTLLKANAAALQVADNEGRLPIHMAVLSRKNKSIIRQLVKGYPGGLSTTTNEGETPHAISRRIKLDSNVRSLLKA